MKPDVCAPGVNVVSAMNFFIDDDTYYAFAAWDICSLDTEYETWGGLSGYFHMFAQTGSSMSAPVVTGTIALWMQEDPTLTTERIKDILAHSCRQPDSELSYPNNQYGYGEVNAYAGMQYLLQTLGIEEVRSKMTDGRSAAIYDL
jgi:subtilisin family serine protease